MIRRPLGHRAFEVSEDPPAADPMLEPLQALQRLQTLRKVTADAEVAMARRTLARAEDDLLAMSDSLTAHMQQVRDERDAKVRERMDQPADLAALNRWREQEFRAIAGIEQRKVQLTEERQRGVEAQEDLRARIAKRRLVILRFEKYEALLARMTEC